MKRTLLLGGVVVGLISCILGISAGEVCADLPLPIPIGPGEMYLIEHYEYSQGILVSIVDLYGNRTYYSGGRQYCQVSKEATGPGDEKNWWARFYYGENGALEYTETRDQNGEISITYYDHGRATRTEDKEGFVTTEYFYDSETGFRTHSIEYGKDGTTGETIEIRKTIYEEGRQVEMIDLHEDSYGEVIMTWEYKNGSLVSSTDHQRDTTTYYIPGRSAQGSPLVPAYIVNKEGMITVEYHYDEDGKIVWTYDVEADLTVYQDDLGRDLYAVEGYNPDQGGGAPWETPAAGDMVEHSHQQEWTYEGTELKEVQYFGWSPVQLDGNRYRFLYGVTYYEDGRAKDFYGTGFNPEGVCGTYTVTVHFYDDRVVFDYGTGYTLTLSFEELGLEGLDETTLHLVISAIFTSLAGLEEGDEVTIVVSEGRLQEIKQGEEVLLSFDYSEAGYIERITDQDDEVVLEAVYRDDGSIKTLTLSAKLLDTYVAQVFVAPGIDVTQYLRGELSGDDLVLSYNEKGLMEGIYKNSVAAANLILSLGYDADDHVESVKDKDDNVLLSNFHWNGDDLVWCEATVFDSTLPLITLWGIDIAKLLELEGVSDGENVTITFAADDQKIYKVGKETVVDGDFNDDGESLFLTRDLHNGSINVKVYQPGGPDTDLVLPFDITTLGLTVEKFSDYLEAAGIGLGETVNMQFDEENQLTEITYMDTTEKTLLAYTAEFSISGLTNIDLASLQSYLDLVLGEDEKFLMIYDYGSGSKRVGAVLKDGDIALTLEWTERGDIDKIYQGDKETLLVEYSYYTGTSKLETVYLYSKGLEAGIYQVVLPHLELSSVLSTVLGYTPAPGEKVVFFYDETDSGKLLKITENDAITTLLEWDYDFDNDKVTISDGDSTELIAYTVEDYADYKKGEVTALKVMDGALRDTILDLIEVMPEIDMALLLTTMTTSADCNITINYDPENDYRLTTVVDDRGTVEIADDITLVECTYEVAHPDRFSVIKVDDGTGENLVTLMENFVYSATGVLEEVKCYIRNDTLPIDNPDLAEIVEIAQGVGDHVFFVYNEDGEIEKILDANRDVITIPPPPPELPVSIPMVINTDYAEGILGYEITGENWEQALNDLIKEIDSMSEAELDSLFVATISSSFGTGGYSTYSSYLISTRAEFKARLKDLKKIIKEEPCDRTIDDLKADWIKVYEPTITGTIEDVWYDVDTGKWYVVVDANQIDIFDGQGFQDAEGETFYVEIDASLVGEMQAGIGEKALFAGDVAQDVDGYLTITMNEAYGGGYAIGEEAIDGYLEAREGSQWYQDLLDIMAKLWDDIIAEYGEHSDWRQGYEFLKAWAFEVEV